MAQKTKKTLYKNFNVECLFHIRYSKRSKNGFDFSEYRIIQDT